MAHLKEVQTFIETPIGAAFERISNVYFGPGGFPSRVNVPMGLPVTPELPRDYAPPVSVPDVRVGPETAPQGALVIATPEPIPLPAPMVVDPYTNTQTTVFEDAPGGIYETERSPTDWDEVYRQYVILNAPAAPGADVGLFEGVDWGSVAGTIVGGLFDPFGAGAAVQTAFSPPGVVPSATAALPGPPGTIGITGVSQMAGCPPVGPKYAKICLATREITPLRRRRRRRLLTSSDIKDLAALKAIVGGAALQGAVVQAIRR